MIKFKPIYEVFINDTKLGRLYSKRKAIDIAQKESNSIFEGKRHTSVVNVETGEIIYKI